MSDLSALSREHCKPLKGDAHRLDRDAIDAFLGAMPDWELIADGGAIRRTFRFDDYYRTMAFVNALAYVAHREDHHPDLGVHYNRCVVEYSTHDVGGLSRNDFICAAMAERLHADAAK